MKAWHQRVLNTNEDGFSLNSTGKRSPIRRRVTSLIYRLVVDIDVVYAQCQDVNCLSRALGYFTKSVTKLHLPHSIVMKLHIRKSNVVILTSETAVAVGV